MYMTKTIEDFPDYEISNDGEVVSHKSGKPTILKGAYCGTGYRQVELRNGKEIKKFLVHRLVAEAFVDGSGETVDHIDNDKTNNHADNLRWMPLMDNIRRRSTSGLPIGVSKKGRGYQALRKVNGVQYNSKILDTVDEAVAWYESCTGNAS